MTRTIATVTLLAATILIALANQQVLPEELGSFVDTLVEARTEEVDNKLRLLADSEESSEPLQTDLEDVPADQEDISTDKEDTFLDEEDTPTVQLDTQSDQKDNP